MEWFKSVIGLDRVDLMNYAGIGFLGPERSEWPSCLPDLADLAPMCDETSNFPAPISNKTEIVSMEGNEVVLTNEVGSAEAAGEVVGKNEFCSTKAAHGVVIGDVLHISGVRLSDTVERIFGPEPSALSCCNGSGPRIEHMVCFSILANASDQQPLGIRPLQAYFLTLINCFKVSGRTISLQYLQDANELEFKIVSLAALFTSWDQHSNPSLADYDSIYCPKWIAMGFKDTRDLYGALLQQIMGDGRAGTLGEAKVTHLTPDFNLWIKLSTAVKICPIFQSVNGYIGIGSKGLRKGDELCFLSRCQSPLLLRTQKEGNSCDNRMTKLVGPCFIHGVSVSVIQEMVASGNAKIESFSIH